MSKENRIAFNARLAPGTVERIREYAEENGVSLGVAVDDLIAAHDEEYVAPSPPPAPARALKTRDFRADFIAELAKVPEHGVISQPDLCQPLYKLWAGCDFGKTYDDSRTYGHFRNEFCVWDRDSNLVARTQADLDAFFAENPDKNKGAIKRAEELKSKFDNLEINKPK